MRLQRIELLISQEAEAVISAVSASLVPPIGRFERPANARGEPR
jgi:hypothetical protein